MKALTQILDNKILSKLHKININTFEDLVCYFPRTYEDRRRFIPIGQFEREQTYVSFGNIIYSGFGETKKGKKYFEITLEYHGNKLALQWFKTTPRFASFLRHQEHLMVFGEVKFRHPMPIMYSPDFCPFSTPEKPGINFKTIVPVYSLTNGLYQQELRKAIYTASKYFNQVKTYLPVELEHKYHLPEYLESLKEIHFPKSQDLQKLRGRSTKWHKRLIFEELFIISLGIELSRLKCSGERIPFEINALDYKKQSEKTYNNIGFKPSPSQIRTITQSLKDIEHEQPMRRLLHGDVGTGKTTVALELVLCMSLAGYQSALMAPTEILARQHFETSKQFFKDTNITCELLLGGMKKKEREQVLEKLKKGDCSFVIGTHALLQKDVCFKNLGFIVIDEQHKFGAVQRTILTEKSLNIHLLQLSATPIPRTITMTLYGDMDVSTLNKLPGKLYPETRLFFNSQRQQLYKFLESQLKLKKQIYVVYPLVEDSEKIDLLSATTMSEELQKQFKDYTVGLIHGRMKADVKQEAMTSFKNGDIDILVSTTVIEVGIDVHNATVMVIEHAERFGLSQLHQLRGRIGRGKDKSYCILVPHETGGNAQKRLEIMLSTDNGFEIAEQDLIIRGPGDYCGEEQSGFFSSFNVSDLVRDVKALEYAKSEAKQLIENNTFIRYPLLCDKAKTILGKLYI